MTEPVKITVRVQPNARRSQVVRFEEGVLHLRIAAAPVKGRANTVLLAFLGEVLGVSRSRLTIEKGATSRMKVIAVEGLTEDELRERIGDCLA